MSIFLPPMNERIPPGTPARWQQQGDVGFVRIADGLKIGDPPSDMGTVSSIPDMWARPLLVHSALCDDEHPYHGRIKAQWRGMLSAIALGEAKGFRLSASLVDLSRNNNDDFLTSLRELSPGANKRCHTLNQEQENPWWKIWVFTWENNVVGMTSPLSLVCPAEDGDWTHLPWYHEGRLKSPLQPDRLNRDDKIQLYLWLDQLSQQLPGGRGESHKIIDLITEFRDDIDHSWSGEELRLGRDLGYPPIALGDVTVLGKSIRRRPTDDSNLYLNNSKVEGTIFLPNPDSNFVKLREQWRDTPLKEIIIAGRSADTFSQQELNQLREKRRIGDLQLLEESEDLFLDDFFFLVGSRLLPGALLPEGAEEINYRDDEGELSKLTPLLPIRPDLLDYFSAEQLREMIKIEPTDPQPGELGVRVSIRLELTGGDYIARKDYRIQESNALGSIDILPYLEVFPNFRSEEWSEYYIFYRDARALGQQNQPIFEIDFDNHQNHQETHFSESGDGKSQVIRLDQFPSIITCYSNSLGQSKRVTGGIILLPNPPRVGTQDPNKAWTVGVDFGTSFTNVYYRANNQPANALSLSSLSLKVTGTTEVRRRAILYNNFMLPQPEDFPISTILTTKETGGQDRPVIDGRIHFGAKEDPDSIDDPELDYIITDLKWKTRNQRDRINNQLFLRNLALLISAEAAQAHVRNMEWVVSYPSSFSSRDKGHYKANWEKIVGELNAKTGMNHVLDSQCPRTEASAVAQYFMITQGGRRDLAYTTCIDIGGGSSDISIWQRHRLVHQCSIQLAGRDLFSQFMKEYIDIIGPLLSMSFSVAGPDLGRFYAKLDALLIARGQDARQRIRTDGIRSLDHALELSRLGVAGLYYYLGKILKGLHSEQICERQRNTPVFISGNGSRIFHWLSDSGTFDESCDANRLFNAMLSKGSGFDGMNGETTLTDQPKSEVAFGLAYGVNEDNRLRVLVEANNDQLFCGEKCLVNDQEYSETSRLRLEGEISRFRVDENLSNLKEFVRSYHDHVGWSNQADRGGEEDPPSLKKFKESIQSLKDNESELWEKVGDKIERTCDTKMEGAANRIRPEPPFIIGLKELLTFLNPKRRIS